MKKIFTSHGARIAPKYPAMKDKSCRGCFVPLRSGSNFWLLSPYNRNTNGNANEFNLNTNGNLNNNNVSNTNNGARPALSQYLIYSFAGVKPPVVYIMCMHCLVGRPILLNHLRIIPWVEECTYLTLRGRL